MIVIGSGTVECHMFPHGCLASFIIEPGSWTPPEGWQPTENTPSFGAQPTPWQLNGEPLLRGPASLAPGNYTFAMAVSEINDIIGAPNPFLSVAVPCTEQVTIPPDAVTVTVQATFGEPCSIEVDISTD